LALNSIENRSRRQNLPKSADRAAIVVSVIGASVFQLSSAVVAPAAEVMRRQHRQESIELPMFELTGNGTVSHRVSRCHLGSAERERGAHAPLICVDGDALRAGLRLRRLSHRHGKHTVGAPWMWKLAFGHYQPCTAYAAKREATISTFERGTASAPNVFPTGPPFAHLQGVDAGLAPYPGRGSRVNG
jgi:hypothetical protein